MAITAIPDGLVGLGKKALRTSHDALVRAVGEEAAPQALQEIGYAAGEELFNSFRLWIANYTGVDDPGDLDAATLGEVLSTFFEAMGWGEVSMDQLGSAGLVLESDDWVEADPEAAAAYPSCFITAGVFADFLTRLANGATMSIMEVECRSRGDARCRFVAGAPEVLEAVYAAISQGESYEVVFQS